MRKLLIACSLLILLVEISLAQVRSPSACTGGVLNGKAIYMPIPILPLHFKDTVPRTLINVRVETNEQGYVTSAKACSGPVELRPYVEAAASRARISPTTLSEIPVSVSGQLIYKYDPQIFFDLPYDLGCPPVRGRLSSIFNGYARELVTPTRPESEKDSRLSGSVSVVILVGVDGLVETAEAVSGPHPFRQAAVDAAKRTTFPRFERCGKPSKVAGVLTYNFPRPLK